MKKYTLIFATLLSVVGFAQSLRQEIRTITAGKNATVAVSVLSLDGPYELNIRGNKKLPMQSVFKFHIALAVLDLVDQGKLKLDQQVLIRKSDLPENTWSPIRDKYPEGNVQLPLSELIRYTVAESDNNGCDLLLRLIGGVGTVQRFIDRRGIRDFAIRANEEEMHRDWNTQYTNVTTTHSMNRLLKKFQRGSVVSEASTEFLMNVMLGTTTGRNKIAEQLPPGTPVAHKTGSSGRNRDGLKGAENDAALITLPDGRRYALTVFVSDSRESDAVNCRMISDISEKVWHHFNPVKK